MISIKQDYSIAADKDLARQRRLRVLIVDAVEGRENSGLGELQKMFDVLRADNMRDAVAMANEHLPALFMVHYKDDRHNLRQELKTNFRTRRMPVLTIIQKNEMNEKELSSGWDDFIVSPFDVAELLLRIRTILNKRLFLHERYVDFQPDSSNESSQETFLRRIKETVEEHLNNPLFGVADLARKAGISQPQLYRKLVALTGFSPNEYIRHIRLKHAAHLLSAQAGNVGEVASRVGFSSLSYFSKCFKAVHHKNPKRWSAVMTTSAPRNHYSEIGQKIILL